MNWFARQPSGGRFADDTPVRGERGSSAVARAQSVQATISNALAIGLVLSIGLGLLGWYYLHISQRQSQARQGAQIAVKNRLQGEAALPVLGPIGLPQPPLLTVASETASPGTASSPPERAAVPLRAVQYGLDGMPPAHELGVARPSSLERRLSGAAFVRESSGNSASDGNAVGTGAVATATPFSPSTSASQSPLPVARSAMVDGALASLLHGDNPIAAAAHVLPTQRLLLPKGAFIDCTLETAIDSTLPGMTTCVTATDTFGIDGTVVLLERGTKLVGETRGQVQQGVARVFVLWTEARTPTGVIVPLDSPAADELGRAGLAGTVERHFWERFGAAMVISTIDGAVQAGVQSASRGTGTIIYNPSATQDVMTESLKGTLNIPPTVRKRNGDRIQVLVARDIDFSAVYELKHVEP